MKTSEATDVSPSKVSKGGTQSRKFQDVFAKYEWRMVPLKGLRDKNNPETTFWTATADNDPKVRFFLF